MTNEFCSRRQLLAGLGSVGLASSAGCVGSFTGTEKSKLQTQLDSVTKATEQYKDPKKALKDGFKPGGPYVPGMGWHFSHPKRLKAAAKNGLKLERPPMLTYLDNKATDGLKLGAVEYGLPVTVAEKQGTPDLFADENADATEKWHTHKAATHVFATGNGTQNNPKNVSFTQWTTKKNWAEFRPVDKDLKPGDTVALNWGHVNAKQGDHKTERVVDLVSNHPSLTTLHAWVHVENPAGVFKPMNAKYAKSDGHSH